MPDIGEWMMIVIIAAGIFAWGFMAGVWLMAMVMFTAWARGRDDA